MTATAVAVRPRNYKQFTLEVTSVAEETPLIKSFAFADPDGATLPGFVPGSHIAVELATGTNAYSLTGSGLNPSAYTISVLRRADGAGGSAAMHALRAGDTVTVSRPRSAFAPAATARHHLLIAAGIGITPVLSHVLAAKEWNRSFSVIYSYRPGAGSHLNDVRALAGSSLWECTDRPRTLATIDDALLNQPIGTHLYVCGPAGFMEAVLSRAGEQGWPADRLHFEPFGSAEQDPGKPFTARLVRSGKSLAVPPGQSLLETLDAAGIAVPNMCRKGVCGECAIPVLKGIVEHRDLYLTDEEKAANDTAMCCVSRAQDDELELDL
ncbi:PDR/VanB family oxidoreductase [Arthrobacter sp. W4I7]|uniref:PDR/VanB family oxidoreductase n=1 Tax=Arthrobacter sp. W4I7 TaxID=3042296 RepID=UPI0027813308|nr:PDR/VanB family oxidoreductase [Arthrobacter sp. W4I7]MDQ0689466.1 ferredoxin-NADP reductase [Arthrobacter sp. W4I7]